MTLEVEFMIEDMCTQCGKERCFGGNDGPFFSEGEHPGNTRPVNLKYCQTQARI